MKKLVCLMLSICLMVFALVGCSVQSFKGVTDYAGEVSSNGGFAVVKGDYVYFVNGAVESTVDNTFGSVVKGALVRAKLADVNDYGKETKAEVVIPKLIYTDYKSNNSGFYIFGDYVYYPTPSAEKNMKGEVQNTTVEFTKTKLDGTDTTVLTKVEGLSTPFRFVEKDGNVFLTVYRAIDGKNYLVTYNEKGEEVKRSQAVTSYIFSTDDTMGYAFYEKLGYNEDLERDESFNEVYRYNLDGSGEEKVLTGAGMYTAADGEGTQGAKYAFVAFNSKFLILSKTSVDTSVSNVTSYYGVELGNVSATASDTKKNLVLLNEGTKNASNIFTANSVYYALDTIVYNDSTYGLVKYNYNDRANIQTNGLEILVNDKDMMSYTYNFDDGEYMYYFGNENYYRIKIADALKGENTLAQFTFTPTSGTSDFYRMEIIGNTLLILNAHDPFNDYVCAYPMNALDGKDKDQIKEYVEEFAKADREHLTAATNYRVGVFTEEDQKALTEYIDNKYPQKDSSSEASSN